jgi:Protein of unknown function (DUF5818)
MNSTFGHSSSRRKRVSGVLSYGSRGLHITTEAGDLWVIDREDVDPDLLGRRVTVEGVQAGYDRIQVDWLGEIVL